MAEVRRSDGGMIDFGVPRNGMFLGRKGSLLTGLYPTAFMGGKAGKRNARMRG
jgi:hypothetical protein